MSHKHRPPVRHDDPGMTGERSRNKNGTLHKLRGDMHVGTLEEEYHVDFGVRDNMKLETLRQELELESVQDLLGWARKHGQ